MPNLLQKDYGGVGAASALLPHRGPSGAGSPDPAAACEPAGETAAPADAAASAAAGENVSYS